MSKKIELLVILLLIVSIPAGIKFFYVQSKEKTSLIIPNVSPTQKIVNAKTLLTFSPPALNLLTASGSLDIIIETNENNATAAQLELMFDPKVIQNVKIISGTFFENPIELLKKIDQQTGKISYAFGISPAGKAKKGKGKLATITFTTTLKKGQATNINFLPQTIITAEGEQQSVLKKTADVTIYR